MGAGQVLSSVLQTLKNKLKNAKSESDVQN